jgi:hypothetical protein
MVGRVLFSWREINRECVSIYIYMYLYVGRYLGNIFELARA